MQGLQFWIKNVILRQFDSSGGTVDIGDIHEFLCKPYTDAAPVLISMYKLAMTCEYASARVESLFSAMSYVDAPRRQHSKSERECALTHLFFERNLVKDITFEESCEEWLKKRKEIVVTFNLTVIT